MLIASRSHICHINTKDLGNEPDAHTTQLATTPKATTVNSTHVGSRSPTSAQLKFALKHDNATQSRA